jgi:hypothetical protein
MAHAQKPYFVFRRNGRVHLNRRGRQFSRLLAAEVCATALVMLDTPRSQVVWRVLATHSIRQFPLHFPSRASRYAITFQLDSTDYELPEDEWHNSVETCSSSVIRSSIINCQWIVHFLVHCAKLKKPQDVVSQLRTQTCRVQQRCLQFCGSQSGLKRRSVNIDSPTSSLNVTVLAVLRNTVKNAANKRRFIFRMYSVFSIAVNISSESLLKVNFLILFGWL